MRRSRRFTLALTALWLCLAADALAGDRADLNLLDAQLAELRSAGRFTDALPLAARAVETAEHVAGAESSETAARLLTLAEVLSQLGRYAEAAQAEQRALAVRERVAGPEHPDTADAMVALAGSLKELQRLDEAAALYGRAVSVYEKTRGAAAAELAEPLAQLDAIARQQGHAADRAVLNLRLLAVREKALGSDHPDLVPVLLDLANLAVLEKRLDDAMRFLDRALALRVRAGGAEDPVAMEIVQLIASLTVAQQRPKDAEPLLLRALAHRERTDGPQSHAVAELLAMLGGVLKDLQRFSDSALAYERALAIREKLDGTQSPALLPVLSGFARLRSAEGRFDDLEQLYLRSLAVRERHSPPNDPDALNETLQLAALYNARGQYARSEPLYRKVISGFEDAKGKDAADLASPLFMLAMQHVAEARYGEAGPLLQRALAIAEKAYGHDDPRLTELLAALSRFHLSQSDWEQAEPPLKRILSIAATRGGVADTVVAITLNHLSQLYQEQGRAQEALPLAEQAMAITERTSSPDHPIMALLINNLSVLYADLGRGQESEALYRRALANLDKSLPGDHPFRVKLMLNLAAQLRTERRFADAEPLLQDALAASLRLFGEPNPQVAEALQGLAWLRIDEGRNAEADELLARAASSLRRTLGPDDPGLATVNDDRAKLALSAGNWQVAFEHWRASTDAVIHRSERGLVQKQTEPGRGYSEAVRWSTRFKGLLKAAWHAGDADRARLARDTFERTQWAVGSEAAASLAQMAARSAKGDETLSQAVRERQDLVGEWQRLDAARVAAISQPRDQRDVQAEAATNARLTELDKRLAEIDARLATEFPDYIALASSRPASLAEVQASLGDDEALILFLDSTAQPPTPEETFVWVVTRTEVRWSRSRLGTDSLRREVAALRCGLDAASWHGQGGERCTELLDLPAGTVPDDNEPLPFDAARAYELYQDLLGASQDLIAGKRLILVPSGPLTRLPLQVLVTAPPQSADLAKVRWLTRDHALTILPAVSSLKALRRTGKPSAATQPMIGFGNPLLDGRQDDPADGAYFKAMATLARSRQRCTDAAPVRAASIRGARRGLGNVQTKAGSIDIALLRAQAPLPETADELCSVARSLDADMNTIHIGSRASEAEVKRLSDSGELTRYRIVHFATHGALAGELSTGSEPGLILTPPDTASTDDDGYLSGSEIASLKLDADWVILSACNTAGGDGKGDAAEALSGLARAFFYAGARTLLVSHWAVDSAATATLITHAAKEAAAAPGIGRAEAVRRAMLSLADSEGGDAHPASWAPFVLVGEGGIGR